MKVDVRIIAATNQRPEQAVAAGRLRQDLLYRLNVFPISLPALRERGDDVVLLAEHFLGGLNAAEGTAKKFTGACLQRIRRHDWPGNVRELKNVVHRAFILAEESVRIDSLPRPPIRTEPGASSLVNAVGMSLAEAQRQLILATLDHCGGSRHKAARTLGISVKTLYNRLREYAARRELASKTRVSNSGQPLPRPSAMIDP